jgi:hypothetical protein
MTFPSVFFCVFGLAWVSASTSGGQIVEPKAHPMDLWCLQIDFLSPGIIAG